MLSCHGLLLRPCRHGGAQIEQVYGVYGVYEQGRYASSVQTDTFAPDAGPTAPLPVIEDDCHVPLLVEGE